MSIVNRSHLVEALVLIWRGAQVGCWARWAMSMAATAYGIMI